MPTGVVTSSEVTTESDTTAEPDLVSFCADLGNSHALRVPALFKPGQSAVTTNSLPEVMAHTTL